MQSPSFWPVMYAQDETCPRVPFHHKYEEDDRVDGNGERETEVNPLLAKQLAHNTVYMH